MSQGVKTALVQREGPKKAKLSQNVKPHLFKITGTSVPSTRDQLCVRFYCQLGEFGGWWTHQALRLCEDRQVAVNAYDVSHVSLDKVDNPRPLWWSWSQRAVVLEGG